MKKIIAILLITVMAFGVAACQKTPESPIVIGKDYETMIEQAMTSDESTAEKALKDAVQAPDNFVFNYSSDSLSISSNVQLNLPEVLNVPIFQAEPRDFTLEQALTLVDKLMIDAQELIQNRNALTKAELESLIIQLKQRKTLPEYSSEEDQDTIESAIKYYTELMPDAPETGENIPETVADGTMKLVDNGKYSYYELACMDSATLDRQFSVVSYDVLPSSLDYDDALGTTSKMRFIKDAEWQYEGQDELTITQGSLSDHTTEKLLVGLEDAKMLCERFFSAVEMEDFYEISEITLIKKTDDQYAVKLYYRQVVDGVPTFACTRDYYGTQDLYARPWGYEFVSFIVSENGIDAIKWIEPVQVVETVTPDAQLLTLEQVTPIFEKMLITRLEPRLEIYTDPIELDCDVSSVALELVRIKEHNVIGKEGLLVPAWVFYGHLTQRTMYTSGTVYTYDMIGNVDSSVLGPPAVIMAINAIDGSVIDLEMGY